MVLGKKFFTVGSIVSMVIMFVTLMLGFVEDGYYTSGYWYKSYHWYSFADRCSEWYWPFFAVVILYIAFAIVAIAFYKKRIKAINTINLISTILVYVFAIVVAMFALELGCDTFGTVLFSAAVGVAFPFHLAANIVALATQKFKKVEEPDCVTPVVPEMTSANNTVMDALKELKELYDLGILTKEEYDEKRQQYVSRI